MSPLKNLLQLEMTRKQFLMAVGATIVAVFGFGHIVKLFTGKDPSARLTSQNTSAVSAYGHKSSK